MVPGSSLAVVVPSEPATEDRSTTQAHHSGSLEMIAGFSPWIAAFFITGAGLVRAGLVIAAILSAALIAHTFVTGERPKLLDWATLGAMTLFALVSFVVSDVFLEQWLNPMLNAALLVIMLGSVVVGRPFTLAYAREKAPPEVWDSPEFVHVSTVITYVWSGAVAFMTIGAIVASTMMDSDAAAAQAVGLGTTAVALVFAFRFTAHYPERYAARAAA